MIQRDSYTTTECALHILTLRGVISHFRQAIVLYPQKEKKLQRNVWNGTRRAPKHDAAAHDCWQSVTIICDNKKYEWTVFPCTTDV
jgi:hypothetical protein